MFAHKDHNHGLPDFPVQQYSHFLFCTQVFFIFSWLSSIPPYLYIPDILYSSIRGTLVSDDVRHLLPGTYLVCVGQTDVYLVPGYIVGGTINRAYVS